MARFFLNKILRPFLPMAASGLLIKPTTPPSHARYGSSRRRKKSTFSIAKRYHRSSNSSLELAHHSLHSKLPEPVKKIMHHARAGLLSGHAPELTPEGSGGAYFLKDEGGLEIIAVFKPIDEEPLAANNPRGLISTSTARTEGLKRGTRIGEGAVREVAAYLLDHPHSKPRVGGGKNGRGGEEEGFAGVPPTFMVWCFHENLCFGSEDRGLQRPKIGSLQQFVHSISSCEDMGPANFPVEEVHKITVLDMRLANTDRNGGNILVYNTGGGGGGGGGEEACISLKLVPIDHGYCLPESLEDCTFEWLNWPQAHQPYGSSTINYIASLDADHDIQFLRLCGWNLWTSTARVLKASTMLLKKGAMAGLTPFEIGCIMSRYKSIDKKSPLEEMMEKVETTSDEDFSRDLADLLDHYLSDLQGHSQ